MEKIENPFLDFPDYNCFACSPANKIGLQLDFYKDEDNIVTFWTPSENYSGLPNVLHGGIAGVLLDEIMFWAIFILENKVTFTTGLNVKYKKVIPIGEKITIRGWIKEKKKRFIKTASEIRNEHNEILASGEAMYFTTDLDTFEKSFSINFPDNFKKYVGAK